MSDAKAKCLSCGITKAQVQGRSDFARNLCCTCYDHHRCCGTLDQFPRKTWKAEELVSEADLLRSHGITREEVARRLGVKWASIIAARMRIRRNVAKIANTIVYEEHIKLAKIAPLSQAIGEFLEWLGGEGVHLMRWTETVDVEPCDGTFLNDCRGETCSECGGANVIKVKHSGWTPHGMSTPDMLASFFEIDQTKLEQEKRHMLEVLRKRGEKASEGN